MIHKNTTLKYHCSIYYCKQLYNTIPGTYLYYKTVWICNLGKLTNLIESYHLQAWKNTLACCRVCRLRIWCRPVVFISFHHLGTWCLANCWSTKFKSQEKTDQGPLSYKMKIGIVHFHYLIRVHQDQPKWKPSSLSRSSPSLPPALLQVVNVLERIDIPLTSITPFGNGIMIEMSIDWNYFWPFLIKFTIDQIDN